MPTVAEALFARRRDGVVPLVPPEMAQNSTPAFVFAEWAIRAVVLTTEEQAAYHAFIQMVNRAKARLRRNVHIEILEAHL